MGRVEEERCSSLIDCEKTPAEIEGKRGKNVLPFMDFERENNPRRAEYGRGALPMKGNASSGKLSS